MSDRYSERRERPERSRQREEWIVGDERKSGIEYWWSTRTETNKKVLACGGIIFLAAIILIIVAWVTIVNFTLAPQLDPKSVPPKKGEGVETIPGGLSTTVTCPTTFLEEIPFYTWTASPYSGSPFTNVFAPELTSVRVEQVGLTSYRVIYTNTIGGQNLIWTEIYTKGYQESTDLVRMMRVADPLAFQLVFTKTNSSVALNSIIMTRELYFNNFDMGNFQMQYTLSINVQSSPSGCTLIESSTEEE